MIKNTIVLVVLCLAASSTQVSAQRNVIEVAQDLGCTKFVGYLNFSSEFIGDVLSSDADTYTLFAVKDDVFPEGIDRLFSLMAPVIMARYMSYSFINGSYLSTDFVNEKIIDSATIGQYGVRQLRMNAYTKLDGTTTLATIHGRPIVSADHQASNGVVHLIDGFLLYQAELITERLLFDYKQLASALTTVELLDVFLDEDASYTLFAPNDGAFQALLDLKNNDTRILDNKHPLTGILSGHVVRGSYYEDILETGLVLSTLAHGRSLTFGRSADGNITVNGARVISNRIMKNGVIFEIDTVLSIPSDLLENTIMDVAQDLGCDYMLHYLYRGLLYDELRAAAGDVTLFALEDIGFTSEVRFRLDQALPVLLGNYMKIFMATGRVAVSEFVNDQLVLSYDGFRYLRLNVYGGSRRTVNGRVIFTRDQAASNGLVSTIQIFMTSASWTDVGSYIELDKDHSELETRLIWFGLLDVLKGDGPFTMFAPENPSFVGVNVDNSTLEGILRAHVVSGTYYTVGLVDGLELITINGQLVTVTVNSNTGVITLNGDVNILDTRVVGNGVFYMVDNLLFADGNLPGTPPPPTQTTTVASGITHLPSCLLLLVSVLFYSVM